MLEVRPFAHGDAAAIDVQAAQAAELAHGDWRAMLDAHASAAGPCWTGLIDGRPIGCAGFAMQGWRAEAWCVLGDGIPPGAWVGLHRHVAKRLRELPALGVHRVEATVACGFGAGGRWLRLLGFTCEGMARAYGPDRRNFWRYARVFA